MSTRLRLFPLSAVLFPGAVLNLHVFETRYKQLVRECIESGEGFGVVLIREGREAGDPSVQPYEVGCVAEIQEIAKLPFDRYYISTRGRRRFRIRSIVRREPYLLVDADVIEDAPDAADDELRTLRARVVDRFAEYLDMLERLGEKHADLELPEDPRATSYVVADALQISDAIKQRLLELDDAKERLRVEHDFLEQLLPKMQHVAQRRAEELERRAAAGEENDEERTRQQRYFGKYFSLN